MERKYKREKKIKVRSEKQKNVHAYVAGTLLDYCEFPCDDIPIPDTNTVIKYNPYFDETFLIKKTKEPIYTANEVQMINLEDKIFLVNSLLRSFFVASETSLKKFNNKPVTEYFDFYTLLSNKDTTAILSWLSTQLKEDFNADKISYVTEILETYYTEIVDNLYV